MKRATRQAPVPKKTTASKKSGSVSREEAIKRSYTAKPGDKLGGGWIDTSTGGNFCQWGDTSGKDFKMGECP
ncbi:hypothetical protein [Arcanobacterium canis]